MAKKSRKRAARYSELSKSRRKRQVARPAPQPQGVSTATSQEIAATGAKKSPVPPKSPISQRTSRTLPGIRLNIPDYGYVRDDLKRVGILTATAIVIIIILAFVLG